MFFQESLICELISEIVIENNIVKNAYMDKSGGDGE